jgi:hypothetical protein
MNFFKSIFLAMVVGGVSLQAQIRETPATIGLTKGGDPQGFIQGSKPGAILFSVTQGGPGTEVSLAEIKGTGLEKLIRLEDRSEVLADARAAFANGDYAEAAQKFAEVAAAYQIILYIPQNFASEAMFYQIESLRRAGRFDQLKALLDSPAGKSMDTMLGDQYKNLIKLQKVWSVYGGGDMAAVEAAIAPYQEPVVGQGSLLPAPNFIKMPQSELIQFAFLRAKVFESKGEKDKALQDYFRVFSFGFAYESFLSKQAMGTSMKLQVDNPLLKSENEKLRKAPLRQIQSVAYLFSKRFPETPIPPQFQEFAVRPEIDVVLVVKEKPAEPAADGKGAPADGKGVDPKGKGAPVDPKGKGAPVDPKGKGAPTDTKGTPDPKKDEKPATPKDDKKGKK